MDKVWASRRLAAVPEPVAGEWLVSWVGRFRDSFGLSWQDAWHLLGLAQRKKTLVPPSYWWFTLKEEHLRSVAAASGITLDEVRAMQLSRYLGTVWPDGPEFSLLQWQSEGVPFARSVVRARAAGCLPCLAEDRAWRGSWCLPTTVLCLRHEVYLAQWCLHCRRRLQFPSISMVRNRRDHCTFPHAGQPIEAVPVRDPVMLRVQRLIDQQSQVDGDPARAAARAWFVALTKKIWVVAAVATAEQMGRGGPMGCRPDGRLA